MTLILLLLVLVVERVALQGARWNVDVYLSWYREHFLHRFIKQNKEQQSIFLFVVTPAIVAGLLLYFIDLGLIEFIASLLVLGVAIGNTQVRAYYRQYLNAETRQDTEAMAILQSKLAGESTDLENHDFEDNDLQSNAPESDAPQNNAPENNAPDNNESSSKTEGDAGVSDSELNAQLDKDTQADSEAQFKADKDTGETYHEQLADTPVSESLIWCNFKYYAAPIFYFVVFGVPGIIFYSTLLYLSESESCRRAFTKQQIADINKWLEWLYWVPSRLVSVGFMFVGHFTNGVESYLKLAANFSVSGKVVITEVSHAAESGNDEHHAKNMVRLAKRNMALFVVVVALLTLYGYVV